ncbi:MAG: hypothetical protein JWR75_797 [Devosia sp.]|nr:hypothetical protein [Devosia sp.]
MAVPSRNPYLVLPVMKALKVLEFVAERGHDVSLTAVSTALKIPKTTTFRYLQTLAEVGFLSHDVVNDRYAIGTRFRMIAKADTSLHTLRQLARAPMIDLQHEFNETINLAIEDDGSVVYIDIVEARRALRFQARIGDRNPMHSTALGKAILAALPEAERKARLERPLAEMASRTLLERQTIERQLRQVTKLGYATETEENEDGAFCVGAPILDARQYPIAAISLSAPLQRITKEMAQQAGNRVRDAAAEISRLLVHEQGG